MAVFAIGDIQGCADALKKLLERVRFDPAEDTLWFAGDLVNRGPQSLEVLRFVRGLGDRAISVLGNHDLHLLAMSDGVRTVSTSLAPVLHAEDARELADWWGGARLCHHAGRWGIWLVQRGTNPAWPREDAAD